VGDEAILKSEVGIRKDIQMQNSASRAIPTVSFPSSGYKQVFLDQQSRQYEVNEANVNRMLNIT
jgi:hypothetical protein